MHSAVTGHRARRGPKRERQLAARASSFLHLEANASLSAPARAGDLTTLPSRVSREQSTGSNAKLARATAMSNRARVARCLIGVWCGAIVLLLLGGCASGTAEESRIAETRAASKAAVLPGVQATNIVKEFFPPTPSPEPSQTPLPTIANLTLALQIGANNQPINEVDSVRPGATVYAVAEIHHLSAGETVTAVWTTADGSELSRSSIPVTTAIDGAWVPFQWTAPVSGGTYAVYVYVGDRLLNSLVFSVG